MFVVRLEVKKKKIYIHKTLLKVVLLLLYQNISIVFGYLLIIHVDSFCFVFIRRVMSRLILSIKDAVNCLLFINYSKIF